MLKLWIYKGLKETIFEVGETAEEVYNRVGLRMVEATGEDILTALDVIGSKNFLFDYIVMRKAV